MPIEPTSLRDALPPEFNFDRHGEIKTVVETKKEESPASWRQFRPAWRALPLRLAWAIQHDHAFTDSILRAGSAPPWPERYIQDREAFAFFISGVSAIEVACYSVYAVCSIASPPYFPIRLRRDLRRISPESTDERLKHAFPNDTLSDCIHGICTDNVFTEWKRVRNSLIHHCAPARTIHASLGAPEQEDDLWNHPEFTIRLNANTTQSRCRWLMTAVNNVETHLLAFVQAHLRI